MGLPPEALLTHPSAAARIFVLLGALALGAPAAAQPFGAEEAREMRLVIEAQLEAFARDDEEGAFAFATPGIRERFGTAASFARMVREQYAVVYRPVSRRFLSPVLEDGTVIFPVQLGARDGRVWVALYTLQRIGGEWRISGCQLVPGAATST